MSIRILAVDTATEACSVALWIDGEVSERYAVAPRRHAALVLPDVEALLAGAGLSLGQLDALAVGRGPGSFTGVRIGVAVVQGLALGADLGVVPVSSLRALARGVAEETPHRRILAALDARIDEIYAGGWSFADDPMGAEHFAERVCAPEAAGEAAGGSWFGVGLGFAAYPERLAAALGEDLIGVEAERYPHARQVAAIAASELAGGAALAPERVVPIYLRDRVARRPPPAR